MCGSCFPDRADDLGNFALQDVSRDNEIRMGVVNPVAAVAQQMVVGDYLKGRFFGKPGAGRAGQKQFCGSIEFLPDGRDDFLIDLRACQQRRPRGQN